MGRHGEAAKRRSGETAKRRHGRMGDGAITKGVIGRSKNSARPWCFFSNFNSSAPVLSRVLGCRIYLNVVAKPAFVRGENCGRNRATRNGSKPARTHSRSSQGTSAESRRHYALARPCSASYHALTLGRDVGLAKSGFRPTAGGLPVGRPIRSVALSPIRPFAVSHHPPSRYRLSPSAS